MRNLRGTGDDIHCRSLLTVLHCSSPLPASWVHSRCGNFEQTLKTTKRTKKSIFRHRCYNKKYTTYFVYIYQRFVHATAELQPDSLGRVRSVLLLLSQPEPT